MAAEDFQIRQMVKRILARRWIDTMRVNVSVTNCVVYLKGIVTQQSSNKLEELKSDPRIVKHIEEDIRSIHAVKDIVFDLEDLKKTAGGWVKR
ncbi:MAG: BON domain-containing protein [Candidatus Edwardsbacteria bacterium]